MSEPTNTQINQQIHKIVGGCFHEIGYSGGRISDSYEFCKKCGYQFDEGESSDIPDYCSSLDLTARAEAKVIEMVGGEKYGIALQDLLIANRNTLDMRTALTMASAKDRCLALIAAVGGSE